MEKAPSDAQIAPMDGQAGRVSLESGLDPDSFASRYQRGVFSRAVKRAFDVAFAGVFLILLSPLLLVSGVLVRVTSPGPAIYRQTRVGRNGKIFWVFKLRTMRADAEREGTPVWATENDPRITPIGHLLRRSFIDEFPQLLNVLRGDMSIVGPRPERPEYVRELEKQLPLYHLRHTVRPGMAGWALIHQGYSRTMEDARTKLEYDLYYIREQSLLLDLQIIFRTMQRSVTLRKAESAGAPPRSE